MADAESGLAGARADTVVAGAAAAVVVVLAVAGLSSFRATAPLLAYVGYRVGGHRVVERPLAWAGLAALIGLLVAVV